MNTCTTENGGNIQSTMLPSDQGTFNISNEDNIRQDGDESVISETAAENHLILDDEERKVCSQSNDTQSTLSSNALQKRTESAPMKSRSKKLKLDHDPPHVKAPSLSEAESSQFDLCTPEGQIAASKAANGGGNATISWVEAKRAARREYNRLNAARARQKHKTLAETRDHEIMELKAQVEQLTRVNQFLLSQLSVHLIAATNGGALQSSADQSTAATSSWLSAISALAEASAAVGNASAPSPVGTTQTPHQPLLDTSILSRLPQPQLQQNPTNSLGVTAFPLHTHPDAARNNASILVNMLATLPHIQATSGKGILELLFNLSKSNAPTMSADDINELRRMK